MTSVSSYIPWSRSKKKLQKGKNYIEEILSSTEMLIIIFVLLAVVFAAAIATRIW